MFKNLKVFCPQFPQIKRIYKIIENMASRRELQTLIRRLQATLASNPSFSTKSGTFNSAPWTAAASLRGLDPTPSESNKSSQSLHHSGSSRRWQHAASSSSTNSSEDPASASDSNDYNNDNADTMQEQVLDTALTLVKQLGWTRNAIETAAAQLGLSPAIAGSFPRGGPADLVELFNRKLRQILSERKEGIEAMDVKDRIAFGVQTRLEMVTEYLESWPDALAVQAQPTEVGHSLRNYGTIADIIWRASGDESVDFSWYAKRAALSGIYVSSELYLLTDKSENYKDTWKFLENRLNDMETIGKGIWK